MARRGGLKIAAEPAEDQHFIHATTVAELVEALSEEALQCRELGHVWRPFTAKWIQDQMCYERILRCPRCRTKRMQLMNARGAILSNSYDYPDGYQTKGLGRLVGEDRDVLRLASLTRTIEKAEQKRAAG